MSTNDILQRNYGLRFPGYRRMRRLKDNHKVCDDSFSNAHGHGGEYQSRACRKIEQTMKTNSSIMTITIRQIFAAGYY